MIMLGNMIEAMNPDLQRNEGQLCVCQQKGSASYIICIGVFHILLADSSSPAPLPSVNAWDKPITASLRPNSPLSNASPGIQLGPALTSSSDSW